VITVDQRGRMGNAMFQWAFGFVAARRLGTTFWVDESHLRPVFHLDARPRAAARRLRFDVARRRDQWSVRHVDNAEPAAAVLSTLTDRTAYSGFFQSGAYLAGHEHAVRSAFRVRRGPRRAFAAVHGDLEGHVAVHVRRGGWFTPPHAPWVALIYGGNKDEYDVHRGGFNAVYLAGLLADAGFGAIRRTDGFPEVGLRDASQSFEPFGVNVSLNMRAVAGAEPFDLTLAQPSPVEQVFDRIDAVIHTAMRASTKGRALAMAVRRRALERTLQQRP
jgi:hypothetical protein